MAESGKKGVVDDTCRSRESPRKDSRKRPEAMLPLTPPEPGGPCGLRNESTQRASPGTPSRLPSGDASARRPLFLPCSPVSGKVKKVTDAMILALSVSFFSQAGATSAAGHAPDVVELHHTHIHIHTSQTHTHTHTQMDMHTRERTH